MRENEETIITIERTNDLMGLIQLQARVNLTVNPPVIPIGLAEKLWGIIPSETRKDLEREFMFRAKIQKGGN